MRRLAILVALLVPVSVAARPAPQTFVDLYVGVATRGGFVDVAQGTGDSVKDLRKRLQGTSGIRLVDTASRADVTVTVVARGAGSEPYGQRLVLQEYYRGAVLTDLPMSLTTWWVSAMLEVRGDPYRKEFTGTYTHPPGLAYFGGAWTDCSTALARELKTWIGANQVKLDGLRWLRTQAAGPK